MFYTKNFGPKYRLNIVFREIIVLFLIGFMILGGGILLALISFIFEVCLKGKSSKKERVKENLEG